MKLQKQADRAHNIDSRINNLVVSATESFYELGILMKKMRDEELYKFLGYETFAQYYGRPEYAFKKSSVNHAISIVEKFPEPQKIIQVPVSKLIAIKAYTTEENREELVGMAKTLSYSDLMYQLQGKERQEEEEEYQPLPKIYRCNDCGNIKGIFFSDLCHCGLTPRKVKEITNSIEEERG